MWFRYCAVCGTRIYVGADGYRCTIGSEMFCSDDCQAESEEDGEPE